MEKTGRDKRPPGEFAMRLQNLALFSYKVEYKQLNKFKNGKTIKKGRI